MFKKLSFMLCASVFVVVPVNAKASDKVLSPVSAWSMTKGDAQRQCSLSAEYENDVTLSLYGDRGQVSSIIVSDISASFTDGDVFTGNIIMTPPSNMSVEGVVEDSTSVTLVTLGQQGFLQRLGSSFLMTVQLPEKGEYRFSLSGLKDSIRDLQSCRKTTSAKIGLVSFDDNTSTDMVLSDEDSSALSLSAYPLGNEPVTLLEDEPVNTAAVVYEKPAAAAINEEISEVHLEAQPEAMTAQESADYSITRIHKPGAKIAPAKKQKSAEIAARFSELDQDLSKPPEFDTSSVPLPEEQELSHEPVQRLTSMNEEDGKIYWSGKDIKGGIKPQMSQSSAQVSSVPVVIPRIDTSEASRRIDITNKDVARHTKEVSNQELEEQLKSTAVVSELNTTLGASEMDVAVAAVAPASVQVLSGEQAQWAANTGDNLREVIAKWSIQENVQLVWDTADKFTVLNTVSMSDGYEKAIANLLNQYVVQRYDNRPVGQLYIDPETGEKMLIVQSN